MQHTTSLTRTTIAELLENLAAQTEIAFPATGQSILLEYVSANPNGPITAVHGRGGITGDTLASLLKATGNQVTREFYVNDATSSRQMRQFARAVLTRYRQLFGQEAWSGSGNAAVDAEGYPEEYVTRTAQSLIEAVGDRFTSQPDDAVFQVFQDSLSQRIQHEQREILQALNIGFDNWFAEKDLHDGGAVKKVLARLQDAGHAYQHGNGLWLRSTAFGDEADRVLVRADGTPTYLAGDLAYHAGKYDRGYTNLIDIWDADHAGYMERTRSGLAALGYDPARLTILLVGPVTLLRDGTEVKASRLDGLIEVVTLTELLSELPQEEVRFGFVNAAPESMLVFDVDKLRRQDSSNPVWNLRYALSVCRWAEENAGDALSEPLAERLLGFADTVRAAAGGLAPCQIADVTHSLAVDWTAFVREGNRPTAALARAVRTTLTVALHLLGIDLKDDTT